MRKTHRVIAVAMAIVLAISLLAALSACDKDSNPMRGKNGLGLGADKPHPTPGGNMIPGDEPPQLSVTFGNIAYKHCEIDGKTGYAAIGYATPNQSARVEIMSNIGGLDVIIAGGSGESGEPKVHGFSRDPKIEELALPETILELYPIYECSALRKVNVPGKVKSIPYQMFQYCAKLEEVIIPAGSQLEEIEGQAFLGCASLTSLSFPEGLASIGGSAFSDCASLTSISLPKGLSSIGEWAFSGCSSLAEIAYAGTKAEWNAIEGVAEARIKSGTKVKCSDGTITIPRSE